MFVPEDDRPPVARAADLRSEDELEPPAPVPVEWTPERAAAVLKGGFFVARLVDPVAREEEGRLLELWRLDGQDALEAGAPLARMMNRYAPVRTLAGFADEAELGLTMGPLIAEQLRRRGQAIRQIEARLVADLPQGPFDGAAPQPEPSRDTPYEPIVGPFPPPPPPDQGEPGA